MKTEDAKTSTKENICHNCKSPKDITVLKGTKSKLCIMRATQWPALFVPDVQNQFDVMWILMSQM